MDFADTEAFADEISGFGPDVVVEQPLELREPVVRRLEGALAAHQQVTRERRCVRAGTRVGDLTAVPAADHGAVAGATGRASRSRRRPGSSASSTAQLEADLELLFVCGTRGTCPTS